MKINLIVIGLMFAVAVANAQNYNLAIQQAKRQTDQNNAEQRRLENQENDGASRSSAPGQNPQATSPLLAATMKNINDLQSDFVTYIGSDPDHPDPSDKIGLMNDLSAAAQGTKASVRSVKELAADLFTAMAGHHKLLAQKLVLARQIHAVFNSSHLTPTQVQAIYDHVQKTLTDADVPLGAAVDVVTDLKEIVGETK